VFHEGLLEGVERAVPGQPLDGGDLAALHLLRQHQAGEDGFAVHQHCADPALAQLAAVLGPHQPQVFPQDLQEGAMRGHQDPVFPSVDREVHRAVHPHPPLN
jgi:hypothetical protein